MISLLPFFEWCETTVIGETVRNSTWMFPIVEGFHLVALGVIGGAILLVDLRLWGLGLHQQSVRDLAKSVQPWLIGSLLVMFASGIPLFLSEAVKCYYSSAFWIKMYSLGLAILFTFTIRRRMVMGAEVQTMSPLRYKAVGLMSFSLWATVAWGGRWIGFS